MDQKLIAELKQLQRKLIEKEKDRDLAQTKKQKPYPKRNQSVVGAF